MSAERALLRRLVEWTEHRSLFDTERPLREFARDARALLAEPEPTAVEEVGPPPVIHEKPVILMTVYKALERERDLLVAELNRINATPRSRAEAEAMVAIIRDMMEGEEPCYYDHHGYCQAHGWLDASPCPFKRAAALLAALTGEEK